MTDTTPTASPNRWRVVDIVVASIVAVASGLLLALWNLGYDAITAPLAAVIPGLQTLLYGIWLIPGVLVGLIVRRPGAALYGEVLAATVSALIVSQWGLLTIESGLVQGLGAELVFAAFLYRRWGLPVAMLAGAAAGVAMAINDLVLYYAGADTAFAIVYTVAAIISGAVIAGLGSWLLVRAIARTGALNRFASGRDTAVRV
jgi:energy-coupling factor transport system substrate-specific component